MQNPTPLPRAELEALTLRFTGGLLREKRTFAQAKLPLVRRGAP